MRHIILIGGLVLAATLLTGSADSQIPRANAQGRWGQIWGTYLWRTHMGSEYVPALVTYHIDGTITGSDGYMFGGVPNSTRRFTPFHGVWERTGWQSIGGTSLYLIYDSSTGVLIRYGRSRASLQYSDDFNSFQGKVFLETLACPTPMTCPDPLDPTAKWTPMAGMPADGLPVTGQRLDRIPAGPLAQ